MSETRIARRSFLKESLALGAAALPLGAIPLVLRADNHRVSEDDPNARALGYRHDASTVDTDRFPRRAGPGGASQFCDNCALYQPGDDEGWGGCAIFPGKQVAGRGWCNAWVGS